MKKNILVIGSGGREHAIVHKLSQSKQVGKIYCIPGNAGIASLAECNSDIKASEIDKIVEFVKNHSDIYMTVVAPDDPQALGLVDKLEENGFKAFGAKKNAALLEASKIFSKNLMKKYCIPTARYETFSDYEKASEYLKTCPMPTVIKADGLALGKGAVICNNLEEAEIELKQIMLEGAFGAAGSSVVIEEFLSGYEVSVHAFTDGKTIVQLPSSQDHKRAFDNDEGLNTGGMGTFSPSNRYSDQLSKRVYDEILVPVIRAMEKEGRLFKGVLYPGLMIDGDKIRVLEFNARFGDPETQVLLPRLDNDLLEVFDAIIDGKLDKIQFSYKDEACVCVIAASGGYPENYEKGKEITIGNLDEGVTLYHAGTAKKDGKLVTNGGRVIGVTALGKDLRQAREKAYKNIQSVNFEGKHYRTDICKQ